MATVVQGRPSGRLGSKMMRSARWAFVESVVSAGSSMLTVILLAHFLSPAEFGSASLAIAISAILQTALLGGMPDALVRAPSSHRSLIDGAFWWFTIIGAVTVVMSGLAALFVWQILGQPHLAALIAAQGVTGLAVGAAAAPTGMLIRKMRTRLLVQRTLVAKVVTLLVSVALAWWGAGAWALIAGNLAGNFGAAAQLVATMRQPHLHLRDPHIRTTLRLGLMSGAQATIGIATTRGFIIAFGAAYGPHAVGVLNFALRLVEESCGLVINTLRRVTVTGFATAKRRGMNVHALFMRGTRLIAYISAPLFLGVAAVAPDAVPLIFGAQWNEAVPALQLMLAMWVIRSTRILVNAIMIVDGQQKAMVGLAFFGLLATAAAFTLSLPFGIGWSTAAYAMTMSGIILGGAAFRKQTGLTGVDQIRAGLKPILFALFMAAAVTFIRLVLLADADPWIRLAGSIVGGGTLFMGLAMAFDRNALREIAATLARR